MMFQMCGVFAEFERSMIQEQVKASLERAKANGKVLGRPTLAPKIRQAVLNGEAKGLSLRKIAAKVDVSDGTVHNIIKADAA
jgi:DNA invertase Pin-like site-specific DNA recombinase